MKRALPLCVSLALLGASAPSIPSPLISSAPETIPRAAGFFDYMIVDESMHRLVVSHTGSNAVAFVNAANGKIERQLYIGAAHGIAVDERDGMYFVGVSGAEKGVVAIDRKTLVVTGRIETPGPVDALVLDGKRGMLYADEDNGNQIWVIAAPTRHIVATIHTPEDSDKIAYDPNTDLLYQNFTTINSTFVLDPATHEVVKRWTTLPATHPHGLAVDAAFHRLFSAGTNGKLVALDIKTGILAQVIVIAQHVDQIALDWRRHRLYCASGDGILSIVDVSSRRAALVADVKVPHGSHTVAVDETTGSVWISYGTQTSDYVMRLNPR